MNTSRRLLIVSALLSLAPGALATESLENSGWRFLRVDGAKVDASEVTSTGFDDAKWDSVVLPHTPRFEAPEKSFDYYTGEAWYRHVVTAKPEWKGKRISLFFEGVMQVADVYVNGEKVARHEGGYLPFTIDLTDALAKSGNAVVAVRADNSYAPLIPPGKPKNGVDFCYFGGVYRNVRLRVTDPVHLTDAVPAEQVAGGGVFARYENVSSDSAEVVVKAGVRNDGASEETVSVHWTLYDPEGKSVASSDEEPRKLPAGTGSDSSARFTVRSPRLWTPETPSLYTLRTEVRRGNGIADSNDTRLGIRSVAFNDGGFFLNGKPYVLRGANRHQDFPWLGNAMPDNASRRDIRLMKEAGYNFLRLAHYPQSQAIMDACDEYGVMVSVCTPGWQHFDKNPHFLELARRNVREMVRWHRNHPSAVMWEVSLNETYGHDGFYAECAKLVHEEYPGDQMLASGDTYASHSSGYLDLPYPVWTDDHNVANPTARWKKAFAREYGDYNFGGQHSTSRVPLGAGEERLLLQAWNHQWNHNFNIASPWFGGDCLWSGIDDASGFGNAELPVSSWGPLDYMRLPKFSYYFYQSQRSPSETRSDVGAGDSIYIANYWTAREGKGKVVVYSNGDEVELFLNGKSLGRRKPDSGADSKYGEWHPDADVVYMANGGVNAEDEKKTAEQVAAHAASVKSGKVKKEKVMFDGGNSRHLDHAPFTFTRIEFAPGELKAIGYRDGKQVSEFVRRTPGNPAKLRLELSEDGVKFAAGGSDAVFVRAILTDADGNPVPDKPRSVSFTVTGAAHLVSLPNRLSEAGIASALIASNPESGSVRVVAKVDGLPEATFDFETK